jgi:hypothetical protein
MTQEDPLEHEPPQRQSSLFLITGLMIGLGIGLVISLILSPVKYRDTAPNALSEDDKAAYRLLIARAYQANPDPLRASQRMMLLQDAAAQESLTAQAQQALSSGNELDARALAELAAALMRLNLPTAAAGSSPTTGNETVDTIAAPGLAFKITDRQKICDPNSSGLLQIRVTDASGNPIPGVQIHLAWDGGLDTFFTGSKPASGAGAAEFQMTAGVSYSLRVGEGEETLNAIRAPECSAANGSAFTGGLKLDFTREN